MKKNKFVILLLILSIVLTMNCVSFAVDEDDDDGIEEYELPDPRIYIPDIETGTQGASGFVKVINIIIGIGGTILLGYIAYTSIFDIKDLVKGSKSIDSMKGRGIALLISIVLVLLAITGTWVPIIYFIWEKVLIPILKAFVES